MAIHIDKFNLLRKIKKDSNNSQRKMAKELGFSVGKLNYCLKELKKNITKICLNGLSSEILSCDDGNSPDR